MQLSPDTYIDFAIDRHPIIMSSQSLVTDAIKQMNQSMALSSGACQGLDIHDLHLLKSRANCVVVVEVQKFLGIFTRCDVMRLIEQRGDLTGLHLGDTFSPSETIIKRSQIHHIAALLEISQELGCHDLPVLDDLGNILGIASHAQILLANQKFTKDCLHQVEDQKRAILIALPDLIFRVSITGVYLEYFASECVENLLPLDFDPVHKHLTEVLPADLALIKLNAIQKAIATGEIQSFEQEWEFEGKIQYEEVQVVKLNDSEAVTIIRNISDRKKSEAALRESEMRFRNIFDHAAVGISLAEVSGKHISQNPFMCEMLGYTAEELEAVTFQEISHPDDLDKDLTRYELLKRGEINSYHIEKRFKCKDGQFIWTLLGVSFIKDEQNNPLYSIALIHNIQQLKEAQKQLSELNSELEAIVQQRTFDLIQSEQRKQDILNAVPDLLLRLKCDGTCIDYITPKTAHPQEFLPVYHHISEVLSPERLALQIAASEVAIATGEVQVYEHEIEKYGKLVYEEVRISPCSKDEVLVLVRDISDRKYAEEALKLSNEKLVVANLELERLTRLKDEFLTTMSHELRTPLNAILGISEGLIDQVFGDLNPKQCSLLKTIQKSGNHLLDLINDVLDVAKIEAGMFQLDYNLVIIKDLCESSISFVQHLAHQKRIQLEYTLSPPTPHLIRADERRIRQILINLLNNAVKFTTSGGKVGLSVNLETSSELSGDNQVCDWICFAITDTGIGISAEDMQQLFQPFMQIDSNLNRQYKGTGLGLNLVKKLTELHGGTVAVESEIGKGSCFTVRLPLIHNQ
ncbi:MAG: PAS domain S-box protein [Pseudanabaenaceae cyanobacterium bins.39]|nr:PAS domain S-box protein [Pseudanabaenaceae cyanobacterium bins.39]